MENTKAALPSKSHDVGCERIEINPVDALINEGTDQNVAKALFDRLNRGADQGDKFSQTSVKAFLDSVARLTQPGYRVTAIC